MKDRMERAGGFDGLKYAEEFDAWETEGGPVDRLLPPPAIPAELHPERDLNLGSETGEHN